MSKNPLLTANSPVTDPSVRTAGPLYAQMVDEWFSLMNDSAPYSILQYGNVDRTGGALATGYFQDALGDVAAGGLLWVPEGLYKVGLLELENLADVTIAGPGVLQLFGTGAITDYIGLRLKGVCDGVTILGLRIKGDGVVANYHAGVYPHEDAVVTDLRVSGLRIKDVTVGIANGSNIAGAGSVTDSKIDHNALTNIVGTDSGSGYGILNSGSTSTGTLVAHNSVRRAQRHSYYMAGGSDLQLYANKARDHRLDVHDPMAPSNRPAFVIARCQHVLAESNKGYNCYDGTLSIEPDVGAGQNLSDVQVDGTNIYNPHPVHAVWIGEDTVAGSVLSVDVTNTKIFLESTEGVVLVRLRYGTRVTIDGLDVFVDGSVTSEVDVVEIACVGETAGTANYTDEVTVRGVTVQGSTALGHPTLYPVRLVTAACQAGGRLRFEDIDGGAGATNTFYTQVPVTNPKVSCRGPSDGLSNNMAAGVRLMASPIAGVELPGGAVVLSYTGSPEGNVTAPLGSYCADTTNGEGYIKKTGSGNTGWKLVTHA